MTVDALAVAWACVALAAAAGAARHWQKWRHYHAFAAHVRAQPATPPDEQAEANGWARDERYRLLLKIWLTLAALAFMLGRLLTDMDNGPIILRSLGLAGVAGVVAVLTHWSATMRALRQQRGRARGEVETIHD